MNVKPFACAVLCATALACSDSGKTMMMMPPPAGPVARFALTRTGSYTADTFFDSPWPSDLRVDTAGHPDLRGFPNPHRAELLAAYIDALSTRRVGFATSGAVYFRFDSAIDPSTLPASPDAARQAGATVGIVDIDPASPTRGQLAAVETFFQPTATTFWLANTLAIRPVTGLPLAPHTRYAAFVTKGVLPAAGGTFSRDADFAALVGTDGDATITQARTLFGTAFTELANAGIATDDLLAATVFTTLDTTSQLISMRNWVATTYTKPSLRPMTLRRVSHTSTYVRIDGQYGPCPIFQQGDSPYTDTGSGEILFDASGAPIVVSEFDADFTLSVPNATMPAGGFPIVLYAHGTGGSHTSFVDDGTADLLARAGYAAMGIDQPLHAARNPTTMAPDLLFFDFLNPLAFRDNYRQAVMDVIQQANMAETMQLPGSLFGQPDPITFDASRMWFFGHSQGSVNGSIALAIEPRFKGGVLSGAGADGVLLLIDKIQPFSVPQLVQLALGFRGGTPEAAYAAEGFNLLHPVPTLLQTWGEDADPLAYVPLYFANLAAGTAPKSILQTEGLDDPYAPPPGMEALATAARIPIVMPVAQSIEAETLIDLAPVAGPVSGNVAGGAATAGLMQYPGEGHFVAQEDAGAKERIRQFFMSGLGGVPMIPSM